MQSKVSRLFPYERLQKIKKFQFKKIGKVVDSAHWLTQDFRKAGAGKFGKGDKNLMRGIKTKKRSSLKFSSFFCPDLGEDQKKNGLHSDSVSFLPRFSTQIPKGGGGTWLNFAYYSEAFMHYRRPKRGEAMAQCPPPLNTPLTLLLLVIRL